MTYPAGYALDSRQADSKTVAGPWEDDVKQGAIAAALAAAGMAAVLASFAGNARATDDETAYRFRLVNHQAKALSAYIRCGSSGSWTALAAGSTDKECSETAAQTKLGESAALNWTHDCPSGWPIMKLEYSGYWIGPNYWTNLSSRCMAQ